MMLKEKTVEVKIFPSNRKKYENVIGRSLTNGELISIQQKDVLSTSRTEVECFCDLCGKLFSRVRKDVRENTYCGLECRNKLLKSNNPNLKIKMVGVKCNSCDLEFKVHPSKFSKQSNFFCTQDCYAQHRKDKYHGDKIYNYQGLQVACDNCDKSIKTSQWYIDSKQHLFCTQECYWIFRKENYKEFYYIPNKRNSVKETLPEKLVREWLDENEIKYKQEAGFLRKYYVDFYLPDYKVILEVNGDYWHVNPEVYDIHCDDKSKKQMNQFQIDLLESKYEIRRTEELESHDYKVIVIWEKDIKQDIKKIMRVTFDSIKQYQI